MTQDDIRHINGDHVVMSLVGGGAVREEEERGRWGETREKIHTPPHPLPGCFLNSVQYVST